MWEIWDWEEGEMSIICHAICFLNTPISGPFLFPDRDLQLASFPRFYINLILILAADPIQSPRPLLPSSVLFSLSNKISLFYTIFPDP